MGHAESEANLSRPVHQSAEFRPGLCRTWGMPLSQPRVVPAGSQVRTDANALPGPQNQNPNSHENDVQPTKSTDRLHLEPLGSERPALAELLRLTDPNRARFLVLDLSRTRLFEAGPQSANEQELGDAPTSLDEAMRYDDPEKSLQHRAAPEPRSSPRGNAAFHGHGVTTDDEHKRKVRRFFEMIDAELAPRLAADGLPLVLFGPEMECGMYRQVNSFEGLEDSEVHHNPSALDERELEEQLCGEVTDRSEVSLREILENLEQAIAADQGSTDLDKLLAATVQGKVATVLLNPTKPVYGTFDLESGRAELHGNNRQPGDQDVLEVLASNAALQGAEVRFTDQTSVTLPEGAVAAGIYRF